MFISESNLATVAGTSLATVQTWARKGMYPVCKNSQGIEGFDMDDINDIPEIMEMKNSQWDKEKNVTSLRTYNSVELFAGGGGLALGFEKAGFNHVLLNEFDMSACNTLRVNRPDWNVIEGDVRHIDFTPLKGKIDFLSGGFPCQAFSFAGKHGGFNDVRGTLFFELARAVKEIQPRVFMGENVKGLVSHDNGRTFKTICNIIEELGYILISPKVLKAIMYQVPQKRERLILIAIRKDLFKHVSFCWPSPYKEIMTLRDALYKSVIFDEDVPESEGALYPPKKQRVLSLVPQGGDWRDLPEDIAKEYMGGSWFLGGGKTGMARRLSLDEPSLTLTCSPAQKQTERCHPLETRPLTVREYARIQTFPDDWLFQGTMNAKYKQIGNAVPVNLAWAVGRSIIRLLNDIEAHFPSQTADCESAVKQIMQDQDKLVVKKDNKAQISVVESNCKQLNLFSLYEEYYDNPIVENILSEHDYSDISEFSCHQDVKKENVLIAYVKEEIKDKFFDRQSETYYSGKRFPSNIYLKDLKYFVPYIKGKGVRDLYIIKKIYVGEKDNGNKMGNTKDYRLMFDIQFSMQLFENYKKHNLKMMRTYSVSSMESLIR